MITCPRCENSDSKFIIKLKYNILNKKKNNNKLPKMEETNIYQCLKCSKNWSE